MFLVHSHYTADAARMENPTPQAVRVIPYASEALRVLGECSGLAVCQLTVPAGFAGPPPHIHHDFDEAIYVLDGSLTVVLGRNDPRLPPFRILGRWSPGSALRFMEDIGAALPASAAPDPTRLAEIYRQHNSEIIL